MALAKALPFLKKPVLKTHLLFVCSLVSLVSCNEQQATQAPPRVNELAREKRIALEKKYEIESGALIKIIEIAGKSLPLVEKKLGKITSLEKARPSGTPCASHACNKATFQGGNYEIVFINNKADWITINDLSGFNLNSESIKLLGLPKTNPTISNSSVTRWENINGIKEISFFNDGTGHVDYIFIKCKTI